MPRHDNDYHRRVFSYRYRRSNLSLAVAYHHRYRAAVMKLTAYAAMRYKVMPATASLFA